LLIIKRINPAPSSGIFPPARPASLGEAGEADQPLAEDLAGKIFYAIHPVR